MEKKILLLRICAPWFKDLIEWKTKWRYREVKKYWETRLLEKDWTPKTFDEVHIKNWYKSDSPMCILEFKWNHWIFEHEWKPHFKLELGNIIKILNYEI
jgi:hypothetical protein